jgi:alpha-D-xyloside xylohydrolase
MKMKFTAGYWNMRPGFTPHFAAEAREIEMDDNSLTVYAPTKRIQHRGDTLNLATLTVRFSSPLENVIRVQLTHHKGGLPRKPSFTIYENPPKVNIREEEQFASLTSGQLSVRVSKGEWRIDFLDGKQPVTHSGWKGMGFVDTPEGRFIHEQLALGVGETVYGLGERFTPFVKNGQVVEMWNEDGGTSSEIAYKNIPFYLTNRGYGVLVSHPEQVSFEVGSEKVERLQFSVPGEFLEYYLIYGPSPKQVLERYTALTGRPALPPPWSFGLWLSTSFTTSYDEKTVTSFIEGMQARDIPLHVFHFDCFWMKEFHWVNFEWDKAVFPDPQGMLRRLKERGLRICAWINPYIAQRSRLFDEGMAGGYLLKRPDGGVFQTDQWQSGMGLVDFTNPAACQWFAGKLQALLEMGVDCFKTDFGERIPTDVDYCDGSDPVLMHNYYTYLYNKTVFETLEGKLGKGKAIVFARSATTGGQQFPVHWGGDSTATFESMAESLRGGLSLSLSGFGFWSHDIGGFEQTASADVYKRWCAFGLLSSHSRLHGSTSYRVPWLFDEEAVDVLRFFTRLKCRLMPYLFATALQAHQRGLPVLRPMLLEFPQDPACDYLDRQYMLGDSLLVAPVFSHDNIVDYYVPKGRWTSLLDGKVVEGPGWHREEHSFMSLPLLVRPGSVIPLGKDSERPDYAYSEGVTLQVYELKEGHTVRVAIPSQAGEVETVFTLQREKDALQVKKQGPSGSWNILLVNNHTATAQAQVEDTPQGRLVRLVGNEVEIHLQSK